MKYLLIYVALLGFSGLTSAAPKGSALKIKEDIIQPPRGWVQRQPAPPGSTINLRIALSQPNFSRLEEYLYEVRSVGLVGFFLN